VNYLREKKRRTVSLWKQGISKKKGMKIDRPSKSSGRETYKLFKLKRGGEKGGARVCFVKNKKRGSNEISEGTQKGKITIR